MRKTNRLVFLSVGLFIVALAPDLALFAADDVAKAKSDDKAKAVGEKGKKSAAELEKEKAMQNPYANDLGSETLPEDVLKKYEQAKGKEFMKGYDVIGNKCSKCHAPSRPLNSQFIEPEGKDVNERKKKVEEFKKSDAALFKNKNVWQIEGDLWQRYVKRMMAKPGCDITKEEGKKVWEFLVYDSTQRKLGANKESWQKHREALLAQFKTKHPARYKELYETAEAKTEKKKADKKQ